MLFKDLSFCTDYSFLESDVLSLDFLYDVLIYRVHVQITDFKERTLLTEVLFTIEFSVDNACKFVKCISDSRNKFRYSLVF